MGKYNVIRAVTLADETGNFTEVAKLLLKDSSERNLQKIINNLSGEPRRLKRAVPFRSMRASNDTAYRIEGFALVYNSLSEDMGFFETLRPGCFRDSIMNDDIYCVFNHNTDLLLGRKSNNTLRLEDRHEGLFFSVDLPNTRPGKDTFELVRRGDISGCSFSFRVESSSGERWSQTPSGDPKREILMAKLFEVSPVVNPAYQQTSVGVRALIDKLCSQDDHDTFRRRLRLREKMMSNNPEYIDYDREVKAKKLALFQKI